MTEDSELPNQEQQIAIKLFREIFAHALNCSKCFGYTKSVVNGEADGEESAREMGKHLGEHARLKCQTCKDLIIELITIM